jgi:hypothetical protein
MENRMKALAAVSIAVLSYVLAPNSAWATDNQATRRAVTAITPVRPKSEFLGQTRGGFFRSRKSGARASMSPSGSSRLFAASQRMSAVPPLKDKRASIASVGANVR